MLKLLHIGYARAGSTTLQKHVFPKIGRYVGKHGAEDQTIGNVAAHLLIGKTLRVNFPYEVDICSTERLLRPGDLEDLARRTVETFGKPRILIVNREKDALIRSRYLKDIRHWSNLGLPLYPLREALTDKMVPCIYPACRDRPCPCRDVGKKLIPLPFYDFDLVYKTYSRFTDVIMLPLELLESDHQEFVDKLTDFARIDRVTIPPPPKTNKTNKKSTDLVPPDWY